MDKHDTSCNAALEIAALLARGYTRYRRRRAGSRAQLSAFPANKPLDDVTLFGDQLDSTANTMVVGHLPFMEKLTAYLITGSPEKPVFKFQNAGIVCLGNHPDTGTWVIRWALMPNIT